MISAVKSSYAMVRDGDQTFLEAVTMVQFPALYNAQRSAEYADLGGYDADPYGQLLKGIDASIGSLKKFRREVQAQKSHTHKWNSDEYCSICGADGRA